MDSIRTLTAFFQILAVVHNQQIHEFPTEQIPSYATTASEICPNLFFSKYPYIVMSQVNCLKLDTCMSNLPTLKKMPPKISL